MQEELSRGERLRVLRVIASSMQRVKSLDLPAEEEAGIAYAYWDLEMRERISEQRFEGAWHCVQAAALGERVFEGPDRVCRPNLEGMAVGLVCSPTRVMHLVQVLYYAMTHGTPKDRVDLRQTFPSWKETFGRDTPIELLVSGNRISKILLRQHSLVFYIAALQAMAIAEWANNYRRYALESRACA
jgi:hypothetical protein